MTNHPRRAHDDAPDPGVPVPPAFTPNGNSAVIGRAVAEALAETLPQLLMQAFANVLMQVPVRTTGGQRACAVCLTQRVTWENSHEREIADARNAASTAAGAMPGDQQVPGLDWSAFLPPPLRPGGGEHAVPEVRQGVTIAQGAELCAQHLPGVPEAGKRGFLIAQQSLSSAMLAEMMRGQPA